jgi:hypothetical protein
MDNLSQRELYLQSRCPHKKLIIFLHIPKAGGTTIQGIINQQYGKDKVFRFDGINARCKIDLLPKYRQHKLDLVYGHFAFGLHNFLDCPSTYFTILRYPVARFISHYYVQRSSNCPEHERDKEMSLEDYVAYKEGKASNLQTYMLYGLSKASATDNTSILEVAKQNLCQYFSVIGLVERFDETLVLLSHVFGWKFPVHIKQNVTSSVQSEALHNMGSKTIRLIEQNSDL